MRRMGASPAEARTASKQESVGMGAWSVSDYRAL